jgi:pyridoxal phosphate enzyme (YggS family)
MSADFATRLAAVRSRIEAAARRAGRDAREITLVGVSKRMPAERIAEAARAGLTCIGENYVQEAREKRAALADCPQALRWHLIGNLQRNKARDAVALFDVIETVDRAALAEELDRRTAAAGRTLEILLQVNVSGEPQKAGARPQDVAALLAACAALPHLRVTGLMTVPEAADDAEATRPAFARLRALRDALRAAPGGQNLRDLSMGMSADFEVAIEEGATLVRVGTALFGPREG